MPTISISLPSAMLAEFEAEAKVLRHRHPGGKYSIQDVVRRYIRLGVAYNRMLEDQERLKGGEQTE